MTTDLKPAPDEVKPIPDDLADNLQATVDLRDTIQDLVSSAVADGIDNVYFVGCGGSLLSSWPAQFLLERHVPQVSPFHLNAAEFLTRKPARLGERSLVITGSHSGKTSETVEATKLAVDAGATVIGLSMEDGSPITEAATNPLLYQGVESKQVVLGQITAALLEALDADVDHAAIRAGFDAYPTALPATLEELDDGFGEIAEDLQSEAITYVLGAGPNYGAAATLAMCYLQEMQWMDAAAFNAGEFFHGAFEVVTEDTPVILLLGEDATRPMAERAKRFLDTYTERAVYLDSTEWSLPGVPTDVRGLFTPLAFYAVAGRIAKHYEAVRGHNLDNRRYMGKVDY